MAARLTYLCILFVLSASPLYAQDSNDEWLADSVASSQATIEGFDALFAKAVRDESWAPEAELLATQVLSNVGADILSLECRETFCRMEFKLPAKTRSSDPISQLMSSRDLGSVFEQWCSAVAPLEGVFDHWYMVCSREGHQLPAL